ncbi:glycosyltransferase family 2 protein [Elusimicrobiota bacterium]
MTKLTVLIPTYNEEKNIRGCIEGIEWADEILVVDAYSTDNTLKIVDEYPHVKIIQREYKYSTNQKNWAIPQSKNDWILIVDADERVSEELAGEIRDICDAEYAEDKPAAYRIMRDSFFLGKRIEYSGWQNDSVIRLFRKGKAEYEDKYVHGSLIVNGEIGELNSHFIHYTNRDLSDYLEKMKKYTTWYALEKYKKGKKAGIISIAFRTAHVFVKNYVLKLGFLDGIHGFILCGLSALSMFIKYSKLWELNNNKDLIGKYEYFKKEEND